MMGEEVFQLHVATPTYATYPLSLYKARQETTSTGNAGAQHGLLSLLVQVVIYKLPTLKFCHGNQTKWPLVKNT